MRFFLALFLFGSLLIQGCVKSTTEGQHSLLKDIEPTVLDTSETDRLPLFYRYTPSELNKVAQVIADEVPWDNVSGFRDGHSTQPAPGYHWYAIKVEGDSFRDLEWFLAIQSSWWVDYEAWTLNTSKTGETNLYELERMNVLGIRYRLTSPADFTSTVFLRFRVKGRTLSRAEYFLSSHNTEFVERAPVVLGGFLGVVLLVLIYNFGYFILVREVSYLYFGFTILGMGGLNAAGFGLWDFLGLPFIGDLSAWAAFTVCCGGLMVGRITSAERSPGKAHVILNVLLVVNLLFWALWKISELVPVFLVFNILCFSVGAISLFLSYASWRRGEAFMGTFLLALLPPCVMLGYVPLLRAGLLPNFFGNDYFIFPKTPAFYTK